MSAAKSQKNSDIPADLQPFYDKPRSTTRVWARWIVRLVIVVIVVTLAFMFVRWTWHETHKTSNKSTTNTSQKTSSSSSSSPITLGGSSESDTSTSEDSSNPASAASSTGTTGGNSAAAAQSVGQSSTLTNTGPGQTLGIFIASSVLFALLYELRLRSKTAN